MVALTDYSCNGGGGTSAFAGTLQLDTTATSSSTVLDFAWNNPRTTFSNVEMRVSSGTDNSTATRRFHFNGTQEQLQMEFTSFTTGGSMQVNGTIGWGGFSRLGKVKHALMKIFEEPSKEIKKEMTKKDKVLLRAKRKSEELLRQMLSPNEYNSLKLHGEVQIPSQMEDEVIFIVKKDPNAMVDVKKNGKYSHKICAVAKDLEMPVGDQLLSKILLLKTDEKKFREVAIRHA